MAGSVEEGVFRAALGQVTVPSFVPRKGVKIQTKEDAATKVEQSVPLPRPPPPRYCYCYRPLRPCSLQSADSGVVVIVVGGC
jgi:hypothetical protein